MSVVQNEIKMLLECINKFDFNDIDRLADALDAIADKPEAAHTELNPLVILARISKQSRNMYAKVNSLGKSIDDVSYHNLESVCNEDIRLDNTLLNRVIVNHLLRSGHIQIAQKLIQESEMKDISIHEQFNLLNQLKTSLFARDILPVLTWTKALKDITNNVYALQFALHRINFLSLLQNPNAFTAMRYAQKYFAEFYLTHEKEIQTLTYKLLSPMPATTVESLSVEWTHIVDMFTRVFCVCVGLPSESPLTISVLAGRVALPQFLKAKEHENKQRAAKIGCPAAVADIELGKRFQYHSTFVCPVSKTVEDKAPVLLICGHVISKTSMLQITTLRRSAGRKWFKCPTCPSQQKPSETRTIFFT